MLKSVIFVATVILVVYPVVTLLLVGLEALELGLALPVQTALLSLVMVPAMSLVIVPRVRAAIDRRFS
jgi:hypothetical protein